jgi:tetratricopeptide (TPR) repeat protein
VPDQGGGEQRYRLLETVRQYARDRLLESGEATDVLRRHRDWFLALVERAAPAFFRGAESRAEIELIELEHDNLRAALQWSEDEPGEQGTTLRLAVGMWRFWEMRGYLLEGRGRMERALAATAGQQTPLRAEALTGAGVLAYREGDLRAAADFHEESLTAQLRFGDPTAAAYASNNLANVLVLLGEYAKARELYEEGLAAGRKMNDPRVLAFALINSADVVARQGDIPGARARFDEGIAAFRSIGDEWGEAFALDSLSVATQREGDVDTARSAGEKALAISRRIGDQRGVARALAHLADVASAEGDRARAKQLILQSLDIRQSVGDQPGICMVMEKLAWIVMGDDAPGAACLIGAAEALRESIRTPLPPGSRYEYDVQLSMLRSHLDEEAFQQARRDGRQLSPTEAAARVAS